ncbi:MAG: PleD family two-component system response regulator [Gammaproteobacteria bacterium]
MTDSSNKVSIFVVEQENFLARIICRGLKRAGFSVRQFAAGEDALAGIKDSTPDFVLVSTDMFPMNGEEFCRRLQSEQPEREFPVFVMTDSAQDMYSKWSHWFSNFRMVDKPISLRGIVESIEKDQGQSA